MSTGRPSLPESQLRKVKIEMYVTEAFAEQLKKTVAKSGLDRATFCRRSVETVVKQKIAFAESSNVPRASGGKKNDKTQTPVKRPKKKKKTATV